MRLTLALFLLGVLLINYIHSALALHNLAVGRSFLYGCLNFHFNLNLVVVLTFVSESDTAFCQIVRRHFQLNLVAGKNLDVMHTHLTGNRGDDHQTVFQFNAKHGITQCFDHCAFLFYRQLFYHIFLSFKYLLFVIRFCPSLVRTRKFRAAKVVILFQTEGIFCLFSSFSLSWTRIRPSLRGTFGCESRKFPEEQTPLLLQAKDCLSITFCRYGP